MPGFEKRVDVSVWLDKKPMTEKPSAVLEFKKDSSTAFVIREYHLVVSKQKGSADFDIRRGVSDEALRLDDSKVAQFYRQIIKDIEPIVDMHYFNVLQAEEVQRRVAEREKIKKRFEKPLH